MFSLMRFEVLMPVFMTITALQQVAPFIQ